MKIWITVSVSPEDAKTALVKKVLHENLDDALGNIGEGTDITYKVVAGPEGGQEAS